MGTEKGNILLDSEPQPCYVTAGVEDPLEAGAKPSLRVCGITGPIKYLDPLLPRF